MASQNKTIETQVNVNDFVNANVHDASIREDTYQLIELMEDWSGFEAKLWGTSIIGFGSYSYKYLSGHEGTAPLISFSPRKKEFSLYVYSPNEETKSLLEKLGKFKMGKSCIYIKKLADIQLDVLRTLCDITIAYLKEHHECACRIK